MSVPTDENFARLLTAFSDGELDAAQNQQVLEYLRNHPSALMSLEQEQRLRIAARRAVLQDTPKAPDALKNQITQLARQLPPQSIIRPSPFRGWRLSAVAGACAAMVLIGVGVGYFAKSDHTPSNRISNVPDTGSVSPTTVADLTRVHVDCSRMMAMHTGGYPAPLDGLADIVKQEINSDQPYPNLNSIGYTFVGAGPCAHPLEGTVHLLYKSKGPFVSDTLSVFVQAYYGQCSINPGKAYQIGAPDAAHPAMIWRTDKVIYFVVGDNQDEVDRACEKIGLAKL